MKSNRWICGLCDGGKSYRWSYKDWPCSNWFCEVNYRVLKSFTFNGHPKKEKPKVHRWKTDKRSGGGWQYHRSSVKKDWKHYTKRKHRAWQREMIAKERYDEFHNRSYKNADDLWSWD